MPELDYAHEVHVTGVNARPLTEIYGHARFYNNAAGRELVPCPDCSHPADALFGDHGGDCHPTRRRT